MDDVMVAPRALCMVEDARIRKSVCRTLQAAGVGVTSPSRLTSHLPSGISDTLSGVRLVFVDEGTLRTVPLEVLRMAIGDDSRIILLSGALDDGDVAELVRDHVDHLVDVRGELDERGLLVTATKLLTGDIFGLEKYLAWGARVCERVVGSYHDKRRAVDAVTAYAKNAGACRRVVRNVECVAEELLMNALYDAETIGAGRPAMLGQPASVPGASAGEALLRCASDGRYLAVSVEDRWGALRKEVMIDAVMRAQARRGAPRQSDSGGAGLGFYMILACATQLIANIEPGRRTEVICLFDLRQSNRDVTARARGFHIFYQSPGRGVTSPRC